MRPTHLTIEHIGPFVGTVEVDFNQLSPFGLFHIDGPTGSGKSTLVESICFALYGSVPGTRRSDSLKSHHSDPSAKASVTLDFCSQNSDYRVVRAPTQSRPKLRGEGTTDDRETATLLVRQGSAWRPVASGVGEVNARITEMLGLNADQFMQVVVLPQGQFAKALSAHNEERRKLLSTLFHTERFGGYAEVLKSRSDDLKRRVSELQARVMTKAEELDELAVMVGCEPGLAETVMTDEVNDLARQVHLLGASIERAVEEAKTEHSAMGTAVDQAARSHESARSNLAQHEERTDLTRRLQDLDRATAQVGEAERRLERIRSVATISPSFDQFERSRAEVAALRAATTNQRATARQLAMRANFALPDDSENVDQRAAWKQAIRVQLDAATQDKHHASSLADIRVRKQQVAERQRSLSKEAAQLAADQDSINQELLHAEAASQRIEVLENQLRVEAEEFDYLTPRVEAAEQLSKIRPRRNDAETAAAQCEVAANEAELRRLQLLQARIDGMAAELATCLSAGDECPVCGCVEHPNPNDKHDDITPRDVIADASQIAERLRKQALDARSRAKKLAEEELTLSLIAGETIDDLAGAKVRLRHLREQTTRTRSEIDRYEHSADALAEVRLRRDAISNQLADLTAEVDSVTSSMSACEQMESRAVESFHDRWLPTVEQLADRIEALGRLDRVCDQLFETETRAATASATSEQLKADVERLMSQHGFKDFEEVATLSKVVDQADSLAQMVDRHKRERTALEMALAQLPEPRSGEAVLNEFESTRQQLADSRKAYDSATARVAIAEEQASRFARLTSRMSSDCEQLAPLQNEYRQVRQLADLFRGAGVSSTRISFERYVLGAYLELVATAASRRLQEMTHGRYSLRHSRDAQRGNAASGLALLVADSFTGREREVSTLSGGETFLASLSLALGLADVVQQQSGGVHIEALFVDEGFGTLDPDALELALAELDRLRSGGRLVGVISHVATLRDRIAAGIRVNKTRAGSTITVSTPSLNG